MNFRALLKSLFAAAVLMGLAWWWWQSTAPDLPVAPPAPVQPPAKPVVASLVVSKALPEQEAVTAPAANIDDSATPSTTTPSEGPGALYALAHRGDPSLPDSAYLSVPLDQAEHHIFGTVVKSERSIESYYHDDQGREWVEMHIWQYTLPSGDIGPARNFEGRERVASFSPAEQDYIRNWAKQQAAAAAAAQAAAPPADPAPEAPAPYVPPQPSGPLVITN